MKAIWKFPFKVNDTIKIYIPEGAKFLSVQTQDGVPCLWALVEPDAPKVLMLFDIYGTGHPMPDDPGVYIGTFQLHGGALVFHLFADTRA